MEVRGSTSAPALSAVRPGTSVLDVRSPRPARRQRPSAVRTDRVTLAEAAFAMIILYALLGAGIGALCGAPLLGFVVGLACGVAAVAAILLICGGALSARRSYAAGAPERPFRV